MSANGRNRGYIGRNEITSPKGVIDGRQQYLNEEIRSYNYGTDWTRPADWLPIPGYTFGEQVAYALVAVTNDELQSNSVGFSVAGNFIVDWGDGATGSFSSGTSVRRTYDYNTLSTSTITSEGFKQVLIKVTPQSGQNLTSLNFGNIAGITTASTEMPSKWLELNFNVPNATSLRFTTNSVSNSWIRKIFVNRCASGGIGGLGFVNLINLQSLYLPPNAATTNMTSMFQNTRKLKQLPQITTQNDSPSVFQNSGIEILPNWNYMSCTSLGRMAQTSAIKYVPFILSNTGFSNAATNEMFRDCRQLEYVKGISFANMNSSNFMFYGCRALKQIDVINLPRILNMPSMFGDCFLLEKIGSFEGGTGIQSISQAFENCNLLKEAPRLDLRNCTNGYRAFNNCYSLETVPGYTFGNAANLQNMFANCWSLKKLPQMDFSNVNILDTGAGSGERFTFGCVALESFPVKNLRVSWNLSSSRFGFTALSEVFAGLTGISGPSATLNITGNPGANFITAAQIAAATALGWTITR
jgi:hypothetical protein